ncbi:MAG: RnfABCDGE type electron transport complex subunit D [Candidatus Cloacimonetes bacterium]|nr:RnfABCDGE type electron transport complex subunit D [Candidatus Cloacimonadota bacterium]
MDKKLIVSASPHLHDNSTVPSIMWDVSIALMPALIASVCFWGINALLLTCYGVIAAVVTEAMILYLRKKPIVIKDGSAVVTGILVSFNIHTGVPWWLPVIGSVFAIAIGKQAFGGLGQNIFNPALLGRAFLMLSWPSYMTGGFQATDMGSMNGINITLTEAFGTQITSATPLQVASLVRDASNNFSSVFTCLTDNHTLVNLFWGNHAGVIGEVSAFALIIGGLYLLLKKVIEWRIPVFFISTVFVLTLLFGSIDSYINFNIRIAIFHLLSGGLLLGAFFMATDMVTSPITKKGRIIFAIGCGTLTVLIRLYGGYPEGVSFAILLMNLCVPLIDKFTIPIPFGQVKEVKQ